MKKRRILSVFLIISLLLILAPLTFAAESHSYIRANGKIVADNFNDGTTTQLYYYHYDALGNLVSITNSNGAAVESQRVEAFGNELQKTKSVDVTDRSFIGKEKDSNNLFYFGARYYDPAIGRFISSDPLDGKKSSPETQNKYTYATNNPLKYVDLNGKEVEEPGEAIQIIGAKTATEYYAELANQPEIWKQAVGYTGGFFSSLGMHPAKTALALAGGYALGSLAAAPATVGTTAAAGTETALTTTELATVTGGGATALAGEAAQLASQAAPAVPRAIQSAQPIIAQTAQATNIVAEVTPNVVENLPAVQQTVNNLGTMAPKGYGNMMEGALKLTNIVQQASNGAYTAETQAYLQEIGRLKYIYDLVGSNSLSNQRVAAELIIRGMENLP